MKFSMLIMKAVDFPSRDYLLYIIEMTMCTL